MYLWLILAPSLVACIVLGILTRRRPAAGRIFQLLLLIGLLISSVLLLYGNTWGIGTDVVIIVDSQHPNDRAVAKLLRKLALGGHVRYHIVLFDATNSQPATGSETNEFPLNQQFVDFIDTSDANLSSTALTVATSLESAVEASDRALAERGRYRRLLATIGLVRPRIITLCSSPPNWKSTAALDVPAQVRRSKELGVSFDLAYIDAPVETSSLTMDTDWQRLWPDRKLSQMTWANINLRLWTPELSRIAGRQIKWKFSGQIDPKPSSTAEISLHTASRAEATEHHVEVDVGCATVNSEGFVEVVVPLKAATDGTAVSPKIGGGFHLIRCELAIPDLGIQARAERYFEAENRSLILVAGRGGRFRPGATPIEPTDPPSAAVADAEAAWAISKDWKDIPQTINRLDWAVQMEWSTEGSAFTPAEFGQLSRTNPSSTDPFLVVLHDLRDADWTDEVCAAVKRLMAGGTHFIVCGLPSRPSNAAKLAFAPAFALGKGWRIDRTPRLTFVLDDSRLGRLKYQPTDEAVPDVSSLKPMWDSVSAQQAVLQSICSKFNTRPPPESVATDPSHPIEAQWITTSVYRLPQSEAAPAVMPPSYRSAANWIMPSSLARRLAYLLPSDTLVDLQSRLDRVLPDVQLTADQLERARMFVSLDPTLLNTLSARLSIRPRATDLPVGEVIIVFAHDVPQPDPSASTIASLLARGTSVIVITLKTPFDDAVAAEVQPLLGATSPISTAISPWLIDHIAPDAPKSIRDIAPGRLRMITLDLRTAESNRPKAVDEVVKEVDAFVGTSLTPVGATAFVSQPGRFLDERLPLFRPSAGNTGEATGEQSTTAALSICAAPRIFQLLEPSSNLEFPAVAVAADTSGASGQWPAQDLARGGPYQSGLILGLAYSPFERSLSTESRYSDFADLSIFRPEVPPARANRWGPQRIFDMAKLCIALQPAPSTRPRLTAVDVIDADGRLSLKVSQRLTRDLAAPQVKLRTGATGVVLHLTDVDPLGTSLTYELLPNEASKLLHDGTVAEGNGAFASLVDASGVNTPSDQMLFIPARQSHDGAYSALRSMAAVATYSGGQEAITIDAIFPAHFASRTPAVGLAASCVMLLWGRRAARRILRGVRRKRILLLDTNVQKKVDDIEGLVAQVGEALGRATSTAKAGAFAGYRVFEPGDQLSSAVPEDLVLQSAFGIKLIPRIKLRIDERTFNLVIAVNVGRSMRLPAPGSGERPRSPKLRVAVRVMEVIARVAWLRGAAVTFISIGLDPPIEPLGPFPSDPGDEVFRKFLSENGIASAAWRSTIGLPTVEAGTRLIYISDFLNEDRDLLAHRVASDREEGIRVGAVCIHSHAELSLTDMGWAQSCRLLTDRSDLVDGDLANAYSLFLSEFEAFFEEADGGGTSIAATMTVEQILGVLRGGRLFDLLA